MLSTTHDVFQLLLNEVACCLMMTLLLKHVMSCTERNVSKLLLDRDIWLLKYYLLLTEITCFILYVLNQ